MAVHALVMMPNDLGDIAVVLDIGQDALTDLGVRLHAPALFESQRSLFLEQPRRQSDLSDVVNKTRKMNLLLLCLRQSHSLRDVA